MSVKRVHKPYRHKNDFFWFMALSDALSPFYCVFIYSSIAGGFMHVSTLLSHYRIVYRSHRAPGFFCSPAAQGTRLRLASPLGGVVVAADFWAASLRRAFVAFGVFIIFFCRDFVAAGIPNSSPLP